jgi:2-phosphosulfolactate phosphatase
MALLAGERGGIKIENFTLGNSPAEFNEDTVGGKFVIMCTTNGTAIFGRAAGAKTILSSGLVNASAVAKRLAELGQDTIIVCSGNEGSFSIEDTLCGGMLVHALSAVYKVHTDLGDAASLALLLYRTNSTAICKAIQQGEHGRLLQSLDFGHDVVTAADVDSMPVVPVMQDGRLIRQDELTEEAQPSDPV